MKGVWFKIEDRFNSLPKVLRLLLIILVSFLILLFCYRIILLPMQTDISNQLDKAASYETTILKLRAQINKEKNAAKEIKANNNATNIHRLNNQLQQVERQFNQYTQDYTPAGEIFDKLRGVLEQAKGLDLVAIDHHTPERIQVDDTDQSLQLWRHSLTLVFKGSFYHTLEYLKLITNLKMYIVIESLQYTVEEYPNAQIELVVSTITEKKHGN